MEGKKIIEVFVREIFYFCANLLCFFVMVICAIKKIFSFSFVDLHFGDVEPAVGDRELRLVHDPGAPAECPAQPQVQDRSPGRTDHLGMVRGRG